MPSNVTHLQARAVRSAAEPLGLYLRAGCNDHLELMNLLASGDTGCFGVVFDATLEKRHKELKEQVLAHRLDAILDTKTARLASPGGYTPAVARLPWANPDRMHRQADFQGLALRRLIAAIGQYAIQHAYTAVLAPTHLLREFDDSWLTIDSESTRLLRDHLDRKSGHEIQLIYPLAITYEIFENTKHAGARHQCAAQCEVRCDLAPDQWVQWSARNSNGGQKLHCRGRRLPTARAEVGCRLHRRQGGVGADGVWRARRDCPRHRYLREVQFGALAENELRAKLFADHGRALFRKRCLANATESLKKLWGVSPQAKAAFACHDTHCCKSGWKDMTGNPKRHYVVQRMKQVARVRPVPAINPPSSVPRVVHASHDR